jgi:hypothetical protein
MKNFLQKIWKIISHPYKKWQRDRKLKQRIEELKKQDPFIYK